MTIVRFVVPGVPVPQGSKMPWGAEANPHVKSWRESVAREARDVMLDGPFAGPVRVVARFVFPRPKTHYRTGRYASQLRPDAPAFHTRTPDADKLQRALGDAFKGVVLRDDSQIAVWQVSKVYGDQPCADITVSTLGGQP
jgi:Holliday junction resolvase RusA-like endonuclease